MPVETAPEIRPSPVPQAQVGLPTDPPPPAPVPEGVVLLHPEAGEPALLNGTGCELWDYLAVPRTLEELADLLAEAYRVDQTDVRADIEAAVTGLVAIKALERCE